VRLEAGLAIGCAVSAGVAVAAAGRDAAVEILAGMAGPLAETTASWVVADGVFRRRPERLTAVMLAAFAGKLVFYGAYVAVMVTVFALRPGPFMASFTGYFIALHLAAALALRRLFGRSMRASE
jgi:hypothetical protein